MINLLLSNCLSKEKKNKWNKEKQQVVLVIHNTSERQRIIYYIENRTDLHLNEFFRKEQIYVLYVEGFQNESKIL